MKIKLINKSLGATFALLVLCSNAYADPDTVNALGTTNTLLQQLVDGNGSGGDISRKEHAQALLEYEAKARLNSYKLDEEKMFMMAPGSEGAIKSGMDVGASAASVSTNAKNITDSVMKRGITVSPNGAIPVELGALDLLTGLGPYLKSGNTQDLAKYDFSSILQEDTVDPVLANDIINTLTNPSVRAFRVVPDGDSFKWADMDIKGLSDAILQQTTMSVSANALAELASKRFVSGPDGKSLATILREESERRFKDKAWYSNVGVSSQESLLRELVHMEAFKLTLQYQQYRMQEQMVSLIATMVTSQAKMTAMLAEMERAAAAASEKVESIDTNELRDDLKNQLDNVSQ